MTASDVRDMFLSRLGMRIGPEMGEYVLRRWRDGAAAPLVVMGGDARTGVRVRRLVNPAEILTAATASPPQAPTLSTGS